MSTTPGQERKFLFLQGPHGPFFDGIARMLRHAGAEVWRVGFNRGDQAFWFDQASYIPYRGRPEDWPTEFTRLTYRHEITDIVLYGDTRPVHAQAVEIAQRAGIRVHVFEEGYLRPYWVTYERDGSNGHSRLMQLSVDDMRAALAEADVEQPHAPAHWGDMRQHIFYGALYHFCVLARNRDYAHFRPHRALPVRREFALYLKRLLMIPAIATRRLIATRRIRHGGFPYHLVLLQLEHDASFQAHSRFSTMAEFLELCIEGFAKGAPAHHHLVFKAHPLEDGRAPLSRDIARLAAQHGLSDRVHFVHGGKLARLLDPARSAVTVNSTAAQQVLWRGIPLKVFGEAVYAKPEFVSPQPLAQFFADPQRPDLAAYRVYRRYLLETSQLAGGFYSARGRQELLRLVVDRMLAPEDCYAALTPPSAAAEQQLQVVG
ncbi:capsule biosynthesis protein [Actibacterium sp. XHP0104]|uniref:capsule biosynthesis protein n=1 Tax=Actibacterium sp. XHP0104 TaxID=2984335 RepID=UPI0021E90722|nr:capsular biosynthesis protein [Actibacterium sp. XHP0104]MCV2881421.1 capsular biosynthesis protein [Actibacterium sp. XHP0104]